MNSFWTLFFSLFFPKTKVIMSSDTFPAYSFDPGTLTSFLLKSYTKCLSWFLFSVPEKIHLYGETMRPFALQAGVPENKIVIIPTGIHTRKFRHAEKIERKRLKAKKDDILIVYAGLVVPRKGIDIMIKAMHILSERTERPFRLLIIGDGPNKEQYLAEVKKKGLKNIKFLSWRKDIPSILRTADIMLLPSRGEGLPGIVMEAMAAGTPVVASDIPCIPDLVVHGKTGYLAIMDKPDQFAHYLLKLDSKKTREAFGKVAQSQIEAFSWQNLLKQYQHMYGSCAAS
jgi:glycosyltransferase involved in cell wall biosynthesis